MKNYFHQRQYLCITFGLLLYMMPYGSIYAQTIITLTGTVKDTEAPLPGVTVWEKDSSNGTMTDENGNYSLEIAKGRTVTFSFIGYKTQAHIVRETMLNITFQSDQTVLEEVVINAGYYNVKDRERTGSIARVTAKDIEFQPVINPLQAIQGRMAGVNITQYSGIPGGGFDVQIRGQNSLRNKRNSLIDGNRLLFIVDGIPFLSDRMTNSGFSASVLPLADSNPLNAIDPNNIESIEILKDADATAIYGSRGANGVVLITTKRSKAGKTKFTLSSSTAFSKVASKMKLMNTEQYNQMRDEAFAKDGIVAYLPYFHDLNGNWDRNRYTDWQKVLIGGTAISKNIQLGINGGNERTHFYISTGHSEETTVFPTDNSYKRNNFLLNLNHTSSNEKLKIRTSLLYSDQQNNLIQKDLTATALTLIPNAPALYHKNKTLNWQDGTFENPMAYSEALYQNKNRALVLNANINYQIFPNTYLRLNAGLNNNSFNEITITPHTVYNPKLNYTSANSSSENASFNTDSYLVEPQLNWLKKYESHSLNALIGGTFQIKNQNSLALSGTNFSSDALITNIAAAKTKSINQIGNSQYKYAAFFARLNYIYDYRYILNLTGRRDGSSRFGTANRFGNFGAIGAAWLITQENFLKNNSWLSFGKLRASYGTSGSDNIGDYQYLDTYTVSSARYDEIAGMMPSRLYNPNFSWEKTTKLEIAADLGLFDDRIKTSIAWYKNRSSNQLVGYPLPSTTGFSSVQANLNATVENSGWEFTLNTINVQNRDWNWTTNFNISFPSNKLVSFPNLEGSTYASQFIVGKSTNIRKVYQYQGIDPETGLYRFTDYNNDGKFTSSEDKQMLKEVGTQYYGGLQNTINYKNISLDFLFQFDQQQNYNYDYNLTLPGTLGNQPVEALDHWSVSNQNAKYSFYSIGTDYVLYNLTQMVSESDRAISDASYIRLKNISLSYTLKVPQSKMESLRLYFQGQNLLTITNYFGLDPEFGIMGYLPPLKTYAFGVQLTF